MILHGNQRGNARELAIHLLKDENDHVEIHELRGFIANDPPSALKEIETLSRATKARQYLYSLSLNPPANENVSTETFEQTIERVEDKLGLNEQSRAIIFHEKRSRDEQGQPIIERRHCHVVWSRINTDEMKAIPLPYTKNKLMEISKSLYIEQGWDMPKGMIDKTQRDKTNFTLSEWQQAKRTNQDPKAIKTAFQDAWATSNNQQRFQEELKQRGYTLAKGDRRDFIALDYRCEVYAINKRFC